MLCVRWSLCTAAWVPTRRKWLSWCRSASPREKLDSAWEPVRETCRRPPSTSATRDRWHTHTHTHTHTLMVSFDRLAVFILLHTRHMFTPAFGKEGILHPRLRKTGRHIAAFTLLQVCHLFYLKGASGVLLWIRSERSWSRGRGGRGAGGWRSSPPSQSSDTPGETLPERCTSPTETWTELAQSVPTCLSVYLSVCLPVCLITILQLLCVWSSDPAGLQSGCSADQQQHRRCQSREGGAGMHSTCSSVCLNVSKPHNFWPIRSLETLSLHSYRSLTGTNGSQWSSGASDKHDGDEICCDFTTSKRLKHIQVFVSGFCLICIFKPRNE